MLLRNVNVKKPGGRSGLFKKSKSIRCLLLIVLLANLFTLVDPLTCSGGTYDSSGNGSVTYCTPCQVGFACSGGTSRTTCSSPNYSTSRASSCSTISFGSGRVVAGVVYSCPENQYQSSTNVCSTCTSRYTCNGVSRSACSTSNSNPQVSYDGGSCNNCPSGFRCTSNTISSGVTPLSSGQYESSNSGYTCGQSYFCINGVRSSCPNDQWSLSGYTGCNYCPHGYH